MGEDDCTRHAVQCYEAMLRTSRRLESDRRELEQALSRGVDYVTYARDACQVAAKLDMEPVRRL
jgi:hypothetical protein